MTTRPKIFARRLGEAVKGIAPTHLDRLRVVRETGAGYSDLARAARGQALDAEPALAVCAALGLDPATLAPPDPAAPAWRGAITWRTFGAALTVARHLKRHDQRAAARAAQVSLATVSRAENGRPLSAASYLALCAYAERHPHVYSETPERASALEAFASVAPATARKLPAATCSTGNT